jgi:phosphatidylethanolamine/phosphatidyl-N-methylethanolamine N-methyltransferase
LKLEAWNLKLSYTLLSPFYDLVIGPALNSARRASLSALPGDGGSVFVNGIGSGLDLPMLPPGHRYVGLDLTRAMLVRCLPRAAAHDFTAVQGNSLALPFRDATFDHAVLHLILAIVPDAGQALAETTRVLRPGGTILVLDKFLRQGQRAPLRRLFSPLAARIATRLEIVFEDVLARVPGLRVVSDQPAAAGGWFRIIRLEKS